MIGAKLCCESCLAGLWDGCESRGMSADGGGLLDGQFQARRGEGHGRSALIIDGDTQLGPHCGRQGNAQPTGAVEIGGFLHFEGNVLEIGHQQPDRER